MESTPYIIFLIIHDSVDLKAISVWLDFIDTKYGNRLKTTCIIWMVLVP